MKIENTERKFVSVIFSNGDGITFFQRESECVIYDDCNVTDKKYNLNNGNLIIVNGKFSGEFMEKLLRFVESEKEKVFVI